MESQYFEANRNQWNRRVAVHLQSAFYDVSGFKAGRSALTPIETEALGSVEGKSLLHLQCHFGLDTLSWARLGAHVTGVDFSEDAIHAARELALETGLPARFICCNVYDLPQHLDEQFDIVFTSFGAIVWLPDLVRWAAVVRRYLKPGGTFFLAEFHPTLYLFDFDSGQVAYDYFNTGVYQEKLEATYADPATQIGGVEYFWNHAISEVIEPLLGEGMQLLSLKEYAWSPYDCFPNMEQIEPGRYVWNKTGRCIPHVYSLKMKG